MNKFIVFIMIIFFAISCTGIGSVKNKPLDKQQTFKKRRMHS